jgi:hypothetical protein
MGWVFCLLKPQAASAASHPNLWWVCQCIPFGLEGKCSAMLPEPPNFMRIAWARFRARSHAALADSRRRLGSKTDKQICHRNRVLQRDAHILSPGIETILDHLCSDSVSAQTRSQTLRPSNPRRIPFDGLTMTRLDFVHKRIDPTSSPSLSEQTKKTRSSSGMTTVV